MVQGKVFFSPLYFISFHSTLHFFHVQSFKDVKLTLLAHRLSCIDLLKDAGLLSLVNVPLKDLLCPCVISEALKKIHTHLIAQMP